MMIAQALEQVDRHLIYWPEAMKHRTKLRFTRIYQYLIRMRRLTKKVDKKIVPLNKNVLRCPWMPLRSLRAD